MKLIVALIALAGVIVAQLVTLRITDKSLKQQHEQTKEENEFRHNQFAQSLEESRRVEWKNYLIRLWRN